MTASLPGRRDWDAQPLPPSRYLGPRPRSSPAGAPGDSFWFVSYRLGQGADNTVHCVRRVDGHQAATVDAIESLGLSGNLPLHADADSSLYIKARACPSPRIHSMHGACAAARL